MFAHGAGLRNVQNAVNPAPGFFARSFQNAMCKTLLEPYSTMTPKVIFASRVLAIASRFLALFMILSGSCHQTATYLLNRGVFAHFCTLHIAHGFCTCLISSP